MQQQSQIQSDTIPKKNATLNIHSFFVVVTLMLLTALAVILGMYYLSDKNVWQSKTSQYLCPASEQSLTWCYKS